MDVVTGNVHFCYFWIRLSLWTNFTSVQPSLGISLFFSVQGNSVFLCSGQNNFCNSLFLVTGGKQYKVLRIYVCYEYTAQQVKPPHDVCMEQAVLFT